jgi:hypothetical protein
VERSAETTRDDPDGEHLKRNRWFESGSLQQRVRNELLSTRHEPPARISSTASHPLLESALAWAFNPEIAQERVVVRSKAARHKR